MRYKKLKLRLRELEKQLWVLNNPAKYKYGDKITVAIMVSGSGFNGSKCRVLRADLKEDYHKSRKYNSGYNYWYEWLVDDGKRVFTVNESSIIK